MTVVQIRTSHAEPVLRQMEMLLARRYRLQIKRREFLTVWGALRATLANTVEYQAFREAVFIRDHGRCTSCGNCTRTVDHVVRVARAPRKALLVSNGRLLCEKCHMERHACLRVRA